MSTFSDGPERHTRLRAQTTVGITWSRLYDLKGTADDKVLLVDGEPLPEVRGERGLCFAGSV